MERALEGLSKDIEEIARIDEALAVNFSLVAARMEQAGFGLGAAPFRDMSRRHAEKAARARQRCAAFLESHR